MHHFQTGSGSARELGRAAYSARILQVFDTQERALLGTRTRIGSPGTRPGRTELSPGGTRTRLLTVLACMESTPTSMGMGLVRTSMGMSLGRTRARRASLE